MVILLESFTVLKLPITIPAYRKADSGHFLVSEVSEVAAIESGDKRFFLDLGFLSGLH